jgi:hypothetical protein
MEAFAPKDVLNIDETGLFFRMLPDRSLSTVEYHATKFHVLFEALKPPVRILKVFNSSFIIEMLCLFLQNFIC